MIIQFEAEFLSLLGRRTVSLCKPLNLNYETEFEVF